MTAVVLAGGAGTRVPNYVTVFPKPLLPLGETAVLEIVLRQLARFGVGDIVVCTGNLAELIRACCGEGERYGVRLRYQREERPLGTVGSLPLIPELQETFLLMNGDTLTTLNLRALVDFHSERKADVSIAVCRRELQINYGVVKELAGVEVRAYDEKPRLQYTVGMGVCVLEPRVLRLIRPGESLDMPDLLERCFAEDLKVKGFRSDAYWRDLGLPEDYERATHEFPGMRAKLLGEE